MSSCRWVLSILTLITLGQPVAAIQPGTDVIVPAAARASGRNNSQWMTDAYIFNPGSTSADVTISWLVRDQANTSPAFRTYSVAAGQMLVLEDVILTAFGLTSGLGALRVTSEAPVVVNAMSLNVANDSEYGQGIEAIPAVNATPAGSTTHVIGLVNNDQYRTNIILIDATGQGSSATVEILDTYGAVIGVGTYELSTFEPVLESVSELDAPPFDHASMRVAVHSGAVIAGASRVHGNVAAGSGDPITLNPWWPGQAPDSTPDGLYDFAIYDTAGLASGGNLEIRDNRVTAIYGTYFNWDKTDGAGDAACTLIIPWGQELSPSIPVDDLALGVDFETELSDQGKMVFTLQLDLDANSSLAGRVTAVGSGFSGPDAGCNGTFPPLDLSGGKKSN